MKAAGQRIAAAQQATVSILLVDDQPAGLVALEAVLAPLNQHVVTAKSGREALQQVLRTEFAVILLDVRMPVMDGFETATLIRQREKSASTPIIFLTAANRDDAAAFKGYAAGAVDYLNKPIVGEILRSKVEFFVELAKKTLMLRELNQALEEQAAELAVANRELETFSYSVSHDLRAPLRAITGFSQLLVENHGAGLDETGKDYLDRIIRSGQRMGELIDDLLGLARVTRSELQREPVDLSELAKEVCAELSAAEPNRAVELTIAGPLHVEADPRLIKVVLENLFSNAFKFTAKVAAPTIELGVTMVDGRRAFFIRDNGAGFDMEQVNRLFAPFSRLHHAHEFPGTGIGLAIVQRVISRHGGRVWAESRVGEGATFRFTLG